MRIAIDRIISATAAEFGFMHTELCADRRHRPVVEARFLAYWLAHKMSRQSLPCIGRRFGKDHTTVMHGIEKAERRLKSDGAYRSRCMNVLRRIEAR